MSEPSTPQATGEAPEHTRNGNCWQVAQSCKECGEDNLCDVCHRHDEPRGDCDGCPGCPGCEAQP